MRRCLTLFLLLVLPLQFAWSAAAAYCEHEQAAGSGHIGHHSHQHKDKVASPAADAPSADAQAHQGEDPHDTAKKHPKLTLDDDCGYCHLSAAKPLPMQMPEWLPPAQAPLQSAEVFPLGTRDPTRVERPNWRLA